MANKRYQETQDARESSRKLRANLRDHGLLGPQQARIRPPLCASAIALKSKNPAGTDERCSKGLKTAVSTDHRRLGR
jgi:hypothetical protein